MKTGKMNIYCMTVCEIGWHAAWHPSVCIHVYGRCTVFLSSFCVFMYVWVCAARACFAWYVFISLYVFIIVFVLLQNAHRFLQSLCEVCICCGLNIANKRIKRTAARERGKKSETSKCKKKHENNNVNASIECDKNNKQNTVGFDEISAS